MRKMEQKKLIGLLDAVKRGTCAAAQGGFQAESASILEDCLAALGAMEETICRDVSKGRSIVYQAVLGRAKSSMEAVRRFIQATTPENTADGKRGNIGCPSETGGAVPVQNAPEKPSSADAAVQKNIGQCLEAVAKLRDELLAEKEIQYLIFFLPYKASMWDSMESIWMAAKEDPRCTACVAPIPYFDRIQDGSFGELHYEGSLLPGYVDIVDCTKLDFEQIRPDAIYFHNPYDGGNYVTSVHPAFYSSELKKYTDLLIYVPYFIPGVYESAQGAAAFCQVPGMYQADCIIVQSQVQKTLLAANGHNPDKIAVLGNPKLDYVVNHSNGTKAPSGWQERLQGKKVFLVCISVGPFLGVDRTIELYSQMVESLISQYHAAVIYRPHPLLEATIRSMRPHKYAQYQAFLQTYSQNENFVLDLSGDPMAAVCASNFMISDYSSLCFSYAVTRKPVAMAIWGDHKEVLTDSLYYAFDYRGIYFINITQYMEQDILPEDFFRFASDMMAGKDAQKERRMALIQKSVVNLDGTSGRKIHGYIMEKLKLG